MVNNKLAERKVFSEWITKVIEQMKSQIGTSVSTQLSSLESTQPIVLNDDDVNKMCGWALFKVQKKYFKLSANDESDTAQTEQMQVISDMCVYSKDVVHDQKYLQLYYPLDEELRNKGKLTLIHPSYCDFFSRILINIKNCQEHG